jgi:tRNA A-37 threonylcarbamoyl transferase component Bud32
MPPMQGPTHDGRQTSHDPPPALLAELLLKLFDAGELQRHLVGEPGGGDLIHALPGAVATPQALAYAASDALRRRGLADRGFFERLEHVRPGQRDLIRKVRNQHLAGSAPGRGELWASGRYQLAEELGGGFIGCVWRALDVQTGQLVALKILHPIHADNPPLRQRFFRGARTLATLSHQSIVKVHGDAAAEGLHFYYAMEYVRGDTLDICVRERRYPTAQLLAMTLQIGDALAHLHQRGLLHRDIKPTNIILTARQLAKLIDFDLVTGDDYIAMTTDALGTALYAPPEAHTADRKTTAYDVYSLARTLEFVLRGREPTVRELAAAAADLDAPPLVRTVLAAALQPDPHRRTSDIASFCAALRQALAAAPTASAPARRSPVRAPRPAPLATRTYAWHERAALASIGLYVADMFYIQSVSGRTGPFNDLGPFLLITVLCTAPSARVILRHERLKYLDYFHWVWTAFWAFIALTILFNASDAPSPLAVTLLSISLALGIYASIKYLLRPTQQSA